MLYVKMYREDLLFEILYADDLNLTADNIQELRMKSFKWENRIEKRLIIKTELMLSGV